MAFLPAAFLVMTLLPGSNPRLDPGLAGKSDIQTSAIRRTLSSAPGPRGGSSARRRASTALPLPITLPQGPGVRTLSLLRVSDAISDADARSEERRVGKELVNLCRARCSTSQKKKKKINHSKNEQHNT